MPHSIQLQQPLVPVGTDPHSHPPVLRAEEGPFVQAAGKICDGRDCGRPFVCSSIDKDAA